jgi:hypothetical protein
MFTMRDLDQGASKKVSLVMNLPSFNRLYNPFMSLNQTRFKSLAIKFKDPSNKKIVQ